MKLTVELPDPLIREVKNRALRDGYKLKDEIAHLLHLGLTSHANSAPTTKSARVISDPITGLPQFKSDSQPKKLTTEERIAAEDTALTELDIESSQVSA